MCSAILSAVLRLWKQKALYRSVLLPLKITQPGQTFQKEEKDFVKDVFKDPARSSETTKLPSATSIITNFEHIREKKTREKRCFTTKVNTKKKENDCRYKCLQKAITVIERRQRTLRGQLAVISQIEICHTFFLPSSLLPVFTLPDVFAVGVALIRLSVSVRLTQSVCVWGGGGNVGN